jgi:hypothetical protein
VPFCPNCGREAPEEATFCRRCGERIPDLKAEGLGVEWTPPRRGMVNHIGAALSLLRAKPIIFVPEIAGAIVSMALTRLWGLVGRPTGMLDLWDEYLGRDWGVITVANGYPDIPPGFLGTLFQYMIGGFLFLVVLDMVSKLFRFATLDMARDAYMRARDMVPYVSEVARAIPGVVLYVTLIDLHHQSERWHPG